MEGMEPGPLQRGIRGPFETEILKLRDGGTSLSQRQITFRQPRGHNARDKPSSKRPSFHSLKAPFPRPQNLWLFSISARSRFRCATIAFAVARTLPHESCSPACGIVSHINRPVR